MTLVFLCILAYVLGSVPFGVIISQCRGTDLRKHGSGNIGAANAVRNLGLWCGLVVLLGDMMKSVLPLVLAKKILEAGASPVDFAAVGFCAILGHNYSCFLKFRGGKGVASTLGVFLFLSWKATLASFSAWVLVVALTRYASLGSLAATFLLPFFMRIFQEPKVYFLFSIVMFVFIAYKHRNNVARLIRGEENKLTFSLCKKERL